MTPDALIGISLDPGDVVHKGSELALVELQNPVLHVLGAIPL